MSGQPLIQARVSPQLRDEITAAAQRDGTTRGDYTRRALIHAVATMPPLRGDDTAQAVNTPSRVDQLAGMNTRARQADETDTEYLDRTLGAGWRSDFTTDWAVVAPGYDT